jgi:hypothetical protein
MDKLTLKKATPFDWFDRSEMGGFFIQSSLGWAVQKCAAFFCYD